MGFKAGDINMKGIPGAEIYDVMGVKGTDIDIGVSMGWCQDYPDPYDFINILLYGGFIQPENNVNYSYFNDHRIAQIKNRLKLDSDLMKNAAPLSPERTYDSRYFLSNRVNPKSLVYQTIYQDWSIPALALK